MNMTLGSLFAGIGGFDLGFERAGFRTVWQCEIDKAAQGVLRRWFPDAALHSDVCQVGAHNLEPVDVVTFGSPCQDLSVAGKRAGLAGGRSGLFHEAARVIRELRERYGKPDFAIWENVPGAFSSNDGKDFEAVVQAMVDLGARDICWRVLDSRYFGVAQRRRRVFLVADFGGERAEQILFEPESLSGDFKKGGKARKGAAAGTGAGASGGGREWPAKLSCTLNTAFGTKMGLEDQHALSGASLFVPAQPITFAQNTRDEVRLLGGGSEDLAATVSSKWAKGTGGYAGISEHNNLTVFEAPAIGVFRRADIAGTLTAQSGGLGETRNPAFVVEQPIPMINIQGGDGSIVGALAAQPGMKQPTYVAQAMEPICYAIMPQNSGKDFKAKISNVSQPLMAGGPVGGNQGGDYILQPIAFHPTQDPISSEDGVSHAMSSGNRQGCGTVAICATGQVTHALKAEGADGSEDGTGRGTPITVQMAQAFDRYNSATSPLSPTLPAGESAGGFNHVMAYSPAMQVRRLTPVECERLQGFPDGHTSEAALPDGTTKPQADGPRYKQLGNAVTVNVAEWIARRVAATLAP